MTTRRTLRWGLLGTARINRSLIPAIRAAAGHELTAVASRSAEKAAEYAAQWEIPRPIGSYEALLSVPDIDVIYIPLPNSLHVEWTLRAIAAGKHVLCEKPLALSVEDVDRIADAATRAGVIVAEGFMYRHHPQTLQVRQLVRDGTIGELRFIRGSFTFTLDREHDVRFDPALGGGSVWDVGCYPISMARYLAEAEPVEVFGAATLGPTGIDEGFAGQMRFSDRLHAQFDCGFRAPFRTEVELVGTTGAIRLTRPFKPGLKETILLSRGQEPESIPVQGDVAGNELYVGQILDLGAAILDGATPRVTLADSRGTIATILALLRSAREGRPVAL
jgi:predicted dehydrogenase